MKIKLAQSVEIRFILKDFVVKLWAASCTLHAHELDSWFSLFL